MFDYPDTPYTFLMTCKGSEMTHSPELNKFTAAYRPVICAILAGKAGSRRMLPDCDIDDLAQEVLLRLLRSFQKGLYDPGEQRKKRFRNYLFKAVQNRWIDYIRKAKRECARRGEMDSRSSENLPAPSPEELEECAERIERDTEIFFMALNAVLKKSKISEKSKAVYIMLCGEGKPVDEVAAHFGMPANTVIQIKSRINQAIRRAYSLEEFRMLLRDLRSGGRRPT